MLPQDQTQMASTAVNPFDEKLARGAVALGTTLSDEDRTSSEALSNYAQSQATDAINNSAEAWLSKFGTANVQLSLEKGGEFGDSSVDWLTPLYDTPKNMLFTQLGMRHKDDRNTVNVGVGSRFFLADDWMFGLNSFVDSDITGHNYRLGLGMELWGDYLKLSANDYRRLSGWHQSSDVEDYDERPADGFDFRANGFLPSYPHLGGTLAYEQYFGNEVALFGKDNRQRNPYAVTVGVNYTPIPMMTFSAEQRMGKVDQTELNLALDLTLQLDKSLRENLSPEAVDDMRKLSYSRYDLVERNNDIVLEYRKQQVIRLSLTPEQFSGPGGGQQTVTVAVTSKHGVNSLRWQGDSFTAAGGTIKPLNSTHYRLTLPAWQDAATGSLKSSKDQSDASRLLNTYVLTATAEDNKGNISDLAQVNVEVLPPVAHFMGDASVEGDYAPPDGTTPVNITWLIVNGDNKPVSGENVDFNITFNDGSKSARKISTNANGKVILPLTSTVTGKADVSARLDNGEASIVTVHYVDAEPDASHSSLTATPASIVANGTYKSTLKLILQDSLSRPVTGLSNVGFVLQGVSGTTLSNMTESKAGEYVATLSGTRAGEVTVTPLIDNQPLSDISTHVTLTSDSESAHIASGDITVTTNNAIADGVSKNQVAVKVTDSLGNPVAGQAVQFSSGNNATIDSIGTTDKNGMLSMSVTSVNAGTATITATVNDQSQSVDVTFSADNNSAQIAYGQLVVISDGAKADNKAANQVRVRVTDSQGNALPDMRVNFSASNDATIAAYGQTTADGTLELPVTSAKAGVSTITSSINDSSQSVNMTFVADNDTAEIAAGALLVVTNNALANGVQSNQVLVKVTDANGNAVDGESVSFTASNGATVDTTGMTNSQGIVQMPVTSKTAGSSTVTATVNGSSQSVELTFTADNSTAEIASGALTVLADNAAANGTAENQVQVKVTDKNSNPAANQTVSFSATNGAMLAASATTDSSGRIQLPVTSTTAGTSSIKATVNGSSQMVEMSFVADDSTADIADGNMTVTTDNAVADASDTNGVRVTVTDANGNPVTGQTVSFSATNGATVAASGVTDAAGVVTETITSTIAGDSVIQASINGKTQQVTVNFVADRLSAHFATGSLVVLNDNAVANNVLTNQLQATVVDDYNNPVPDVSVAFRASNGATVNTQGVTDAGGKATATLSSTIAGVSTVTATVNGMESTADVTFVADHSTATILEGNVTVTADNAVANGTVPNRVQVKVTDAGGNVVGGELVTFTSSNGATVTQDGTTDNNGMLTVAVTSLQAGSSIVNVTVNGTTLPVSVTFVADDSTAEITDGHFTIVTDGAVADGSAKNAVNVLVTDKQGNAVSGQTMTFSATNGATVIATGTTDARGSMTAQVTSLTAGVSTVTATVNGSSQHLDLTFVADSSSEQIAAGDLKVTADNAVANGTASNTVQVRVTDASGNPINAAEVDFTASNGAIMAASALTTADGSVLVSVTSLKAGDSTITASINGSSQSVVVTFIGDDGTAQIAAGDMTVSADNAIADGSASNQVQVKVTDANGNPITGQDVSFSSSNGATIAASGTTDVNGLVQMDVFSKTAGSSTITAKVNSSTQSVDVTFTADNSTAQIAAGDLIVVKDNAVADGTDANIVKARATDANGNPLSGLSVSFSADNGATQGHQGLTDSNGEVSVTISNVTAGITQVTATVNGSSHTVPITFIADSSTAAIAPVDIVLLNDGAKANGSDADTVQVTVKDANGNVVADQNVSFSADNSATITTDGTTDANGVVKVPVTTTLAGTSMVTASVNGTSQTIVATFVADSTTAQIKDGDIEIIVNDSLSDGVAQNQVMVKVTDNNNNPVDGADVAFSATNGAKVAATATTNGSGVVTVPVTNTTQGFSQVAATINGSTKTVEMFFIASTIPVITDVQDKTGKMTGSLTSGQSSDEKQPTLSGTADSNATIRLFDNGNQIASGTADAGGLWSITPSRALSGDGDHTLTVTGALTPASNQSPQSEAFVLNLDTVAQLPTIDTLSDSNGKIPRNGMTNGNKLHEVGTSEPDATVKLYAIRVADNIHALLGNVTADSQGNWSYTITDERLFQHTGDYRFSAVTVDVAGNSSKESEMDDYPVAYQSWPAPLDTPGYTLTTSGEIVDQAHVESLLSSTGNALLSSQIPTDGYSGKIYLPAPSSANAGNRVYIDISTGDDVGLYQDTKLIKVLPVGSETTWYSNGTGWKQIY